MQMLFFFLAKLDSSLPMGENLIGQDFIHLRQDF